MPRSPSVTLPSPHVRMVVGRYLLAASGKGASLYDLLLLRAFTSPPQMPREAWSLATYGTTAIAIDDKGGSTVELSTGQTTELATPSGGTFAEVAGGTTILANDGTQYIVGATRGGAPTARVLRLGTDGALTFVALSSPRAGACATWVPGRGLVVVGGSATAPGAEVLAPGAAIGAPLPFPPDATQLCGAGTLDTGHVVVAGGVGGTAAGARVFDLACSAACAPSIWPGAVPLRRADVVALAADAAFVVGDDADGNSHAYRASAAGVLEVPFRVPRKGARLATMPYRALAVVGGAPEVEQYLE